VFFETYELFQIPHATPSNFMHAATTYYNINIYFNNNYAQITGNAVYGGAMDLCRIRVDYESTTELGSVFLIMYDILNIEMEGNSVSSDLFKCVRVKIESQAAALQNF